MLKSITVHHKVKDFFGHTVSMTSTEDWNLDKDKVDTCFRKLLAADPNEVYVHFCDGEIGLCFYREYNSSGITMVRHTGPHSRDLPETVTTRHAKKLVHGMMEG